MSSNSQQHVISVKSIHPSNRFTNGHLTPLNSNDYNKSSSNLANSTTQLFNSSLNSININNKNINNVANGGSNNSNNNTNVAYQRRFN